MANITSAVILIMTTPLRNLLVLLLFVTMHPACQKTENPNPDPPTPTTPTTPADTTISVAPPFSENNCKVQYIAIRTIDGSITGSTFTYLFNSQNQATNFRYFDPLLNYMVVEYSPTYLPGRVMMDKDDYFNLNANSSIKEFHGHEDLYPSNYKRVIRYYYDANGYMSKSLYFTDSLALSPVDSIVFTWKDGNLAKSTDSRANKPYQTEFEYQYDTSKKVKSFICMFPNDELFYSQSIVNMGKMSRNVPITSSSKIFDNTVLRSAFYSRYTNYDIDVIGNVRGFTLLDDGGVLAGNCSYVISYKCP